MGILDNLSAAASKSGPVQSLKRTMDSIYSGQPITSEQMTDNVGEMTGLKGSMEGIGAAKRGLQGEPMVQPEAPQDNELHAETSDRSFNVASALDTVDQVMQHGYGKSGLSQPQDQGQQDQGAIQEPSDESSVAMADGGPVPDANGNDAQPQGAIPEQPPQGQQPQQPSMQQGQGGGQAKFIASMLQGIGAMPIPQAQQLEHQTGQSDPNLAKLQAAHQLAQSQGPDAAWSYLQSLRKQYDFNRTNAAVKANQGNLAQSTEAATHAMTNILDGTKTHFTPTPDGKGVKVTVHKLGGQ